MKPLPLLAAQVRRNLDRLGQGHIAMTFGPTAAAIYPPAGLPVVGLDVSAGEVVETVYDSRDATAISNPRAPRPGSSHASGR